MHKVLVLLLSVLAGSAVASNCSPYPKGDWKPTQASALQFEHEWLQVLNEKNAAVLNCMLAGEFRDTSRKGALRPKDQVLRELTQHGEQDLYQQKLTDLEADLFGDTAVVHGVNLISDPEGHEVLRFRFTDVLHFTNGHWLAVAAQETDEQPQH